MRFARCLAGLCLIAAVGGGCDTTQPLQVQEQSVELSFKAVSAQVKTFNVYDVLRDNDGDEQPDDGIIELWCETVPAGNPSNPTVNPTSVPWHYSVDIKVLRAGETVARQISSARARNLSCPPPVGGVPNCNVAAYETGLGLLGISLPPKPPICSAGGKAVVCPLGGGPPAGGNRYIFRDVRNQSGATESLMFSSPSALFLEIKDDPAMPRGLGQGLCSAGNPGPANIDGAPQPLAIAITKGDTVIVKARLAEQVPQGGGVSGLLVGGGSPPNSLAATMTLEGRTINLSGTSSGTAVSFSYTSR